MFSKSLFYLFHFSFSNISLIIIVTNDAFVIDLFQPCDHMPTSFPPTNQNYLPLSAQPMKMRETEIFERQIKKHSLGCQVRCQARLDCQDLS